MPIKFRLNLLHMKVNKNPIARRLLHTKHYHYIERYVNKFQEGCLSRKNLRQLKNLLHHKGESNLSDIELKYLVQCELHLYLYQHFKAIMKYIKFRSLEELLTYYVQRFERKYKKYIPLLECYLDELGYNDPYLMRDVERAKKKVDAMRFERGLTPYAAGPVSMAEIDTMTGHQFSRFIASCYILLFGAIKVIERKTNDFGGDLESTFSNGWRLVTQVKRSIDPVSRRAVSDAFSAKAHYVTNAAEVVTNSYFTTSAREHAMATGVRLIDRDVLATWVMKYRNSFNYLSIH